MRRTVGPTIHARALLRAAEILGGTEALREYLGVDPPRLSLWLKGRVDPPTEVFLRCVDVLIDGTLQELRRASASELSRAAPQDYLEFRSAGNVARCTRCDGTRFRLCIPGTPLDGLAELACTACGKLAIHGNLIVQLGAEAVQRAAAGVARIRKQQEMRFGSAPGFTKPRGAAPAPETRAPAADQAAAPSDAGPDPSKS